MLLMDRKNERKEKKRKLVDLLKGKAKSAAMRWYVHLLLRGEENILKEGA